MHRFASAVLLLAPGFPLRMLSGIIGNIWIFLSFIREEAISFHCCLPVYTPDTPSYLELFIYKVNS